MGTHIVGSLGRPTKAFVHYKMTIRESAHYKTTIREGAHYKVYSAHNAGINYNAAPGIIIRSFFC